MHCLLKFLVLNVFKKMLEKFYAWWINLELLNPFVSPGLLLLSEDEQWIVLWLRSWSLKGTGNWILNFVIDFLKNLSRQKIIYDLQEAWKSISGVCASILEVKEMKKNMDPQLKSKDQQITEAPEKAERLLAPCQSLLQPLQISVGAKSIKCVT